MSRLLVVALTVGGAAWMGWVIAEPAIADSLSAGATTIAQLERAVAWDPGNPDLRLRLGRAHAALVEVGDSARARLHVHAALRQRPTHGGTWLQLALLADRGGDRGRAVQALETAVRLDRHDVGLRWEAALLALRWNARDQALDHLRYVLAVDPSRRDAAFQLARTLLGPDEPVAGLLPADAESLIGVLEAALRHGDLALARAAWERRAPLTPAIPTGLQRRYVDVLVREGEAAAARRLWTTLQRGAVSSNPTNAVWNGGFEADTLLDWGFDWRVTRVWGVEVTLDRFIAAQGRQSLRLVFNSFPTLDFSGVFQLVAVEAGREHRLRALARALDFTTQSGLKLQVVEPRGESVLAETAAIAGTTADWVPLEARVRIPSGVTLVHVRLRREKASGPEGNLGGKVWLDEVSLTPVAGAVSSVLPFSSFQFSLLAFPDVALFPSWDRGRGEGP